MAPIKVVVAGPAKTGKSVLANFLADPLSEPVRGPYRPTKGVRILEASIQSAGRRSGGSPVKSDAAVELWDVSGSTDHEHCWPAVIRDAVGLILVLNPDVEEHEQELVMWHDAFTAQGIRTEQCIVFANQSSHMKGNPRDVELPAKLDGIQMVKTNTASAPDHVRETFQDFVMALKSFVARKQNQEEMSIMT